MDAISLAHEATEGGEDAPSRLYLLAGDSEFSLLVYICWGQDSAGHVDDGGLGVISNVKGEAEPLGEGPIEGSGVFKGLEGYHVSWGPVAGGGKEGVVTVFCLVVESLGAEVNVGGLLDTELWGPSEVGVAGEAFPDFFKG